MAENTPEREDEDRAEEQGDNSDDSRNPSPIYSPVCTYCWWWKPSDGHSCAAYMARNSIPAAIWNGANKHLQPYDGDHGIIFVLHPDAKRPPAWARHALRPADPAVKPMLATSEQLKAKGKKGTGA